MRLMDVLILAIILLVGIVYNQKRKIKQQNEEKNSAKITRTQMQAAKFLENLGYDIIAFQQITPIAVKIDGRTYSDSIRGDLVAEKDGRRYIISINNKDTNKIGSNRLERWELLSLYLLYRPVGIISLGMPQKQLQHIDFEIGDEDRQQQKRTVPWAYIMAVGFGALIFWLGELLISQGW